MVSWGELSRAQPEFAQRVKAKFAEGRHKTLATLRADGSPRISGLECEFTEEELQFGSMPGARKLADLERDPRFALHGPTGNPPVGKEHEWSGEAKIAGRARPAGEIVAEDGADSPAGFLFTADISEVAITGINAEATRLVVEFWTEDQGLRRIERD